MKTVMLTIEKKVTLTIDGKKVTVPEGTTVLEAAKTAGIHIPTLCYLEDINKVGACRICTVEVNNRLQAACICPQKKAWLLRPTRPESGS